jgi:hypothetical protein
MRHRILIALAVCVALFCASCMWSQESSFFSSFSTRQLVERNKSSAGLTCDPIGGGGAGGGFYLAYAVKNVRGRVQISGRLIRPDYYDVHADLDETGN